MGKKKQGNAIGRGIIKDRFGPGKRTVGDNSFLHTSELNDGYDWGRLNLQSVTEQSHLDEFLSTAQLAGTEFTAEKLNIKFVDPQRAATLSEEEKKRIREAQDEHRSLLRIPRRPKWDESTTAEQLDLRERDAFLEWRRNLASLQDVEHIVMTPYEKNLDFWRQLWRVIERSDVVVQIVDARSPLLFRCEDIESYVREVGSTKVNLLLVNKADYLTEEQRQHWVDYFTSQNVRVVFWSALQEANRQKEEAKQEEEGDVAVDTDSDDPQGMECENTQSENSEPSSETQNRLSDNSNVDTDQTGSPRLHSEAGSENVDSGKGDNSCSADVSRFNSASIVSGPDLLDILRNLHTGDKYKADVTTVGMIGYPNVGKSSTINAILQMKKVPVSATPGRTKHFQTLFVEPTLMLCDCPGLVFPSFVSTKADLVVNGILPIDQMRDHVPPVSLICERIPRRTLETMYSINIPLPESEDVDENIQPTAHELLNAYGLMRGYMTSNGLPDCPRSSRYILKDYVNGRLLYCHPPPGLDAAHFQATPTLEEGGVAHPGGQEDLTLKAKAPHTTSLDKEFFAKAKMSAHSKGTHGVSKYIRTEGLQQVSAESSQSSTPFSSQTSINTKPWKRHNNKHKKEKLRRIHSDHDK
ncbi:large subunit GTPase 1 homolog [Haliotis rufescens]|uniref:large subunit GTPase 1 homolog n=1 Tax=Haliotis rufescens TaxID=6454 RepID=UPI00201F2919|nr:large subunit GTPase 1 homolog [Haliotis rufescens]